MTIRQSISKLTRRTWGQAQYPSELEDHLYWWLAYYHFVRPHESLRIKIAEPIQRKGKQRPGLSERVDQLPAAIKGIGGDKIEGESEHRLCLHRTCQRKFEQKRARLSAF